MRHLTHQVFRLESPLNDKSQIALARINAIFGTDEGEHGPDLLVSHLPEEIGEDYWKNLPGMAEPSPEQILDALVQEAAWDSEGDGVVDASDFSLPNDATDYLISVRFTEDEICKVTMEI